MKKQEDIALTRAMLWFVAAMVLECVLLFLNRYYIGFRADGASIALAEALHIVVRVLAVVGLVLGVVFLLVGNYLPKCKQNYTIGIKIAWTLHSEENWNRTHRFAGPIWVVCGMIIMVSAIFGGVFLWVMLAAFLVMIIAPVVYSYLLFRKAQK